MIKSIRLFLIENVAQFNSVNACKKSSNKQSQRTPEQRYFCCVDNPYCKIFYVLLVDIIDLRVTIWQATGLTARRYSHGVDRTFWQRFHQMFINVFFNFPVFCLNVCYNYG